MSGSWLHTSRAAKVRDIAHDHKTRFQLFVFVVTFLLLTVSCLCLFTYQAPQRWTTRQREGPTRVSTSLNTTTREGNTTAASSPSSLATLSQPASTAATRTPVYLALFRPPDAPDLTGVQLDLQTRIRNHLQEDQSSLPAPPLEGFLSMGRRSATVVHPRSSTWQTTPTEVARPPEPVDVEARLGRVSYRFDAYPSQFVRDGERGE